MPLLLFPERLRTVNYTRYHHARDARDARSVIDESVRRLTALTYSPAPASSFSGNILRPRNMTPVTMETKQLQLPKHGQRK